MQRVPAACFILRADYFHARAHRRPNLLRFPPDLLTQSQLSKIDSLVHVNNAIYIFRKRFMKLRSIQSVSRDRARSGTSVEPERVHAYAFARNAMNIFACTRLPRVSIHRNRAQTHVE